jgi:hypothetical protein
MYVCIYIYICLCVYMYIYICIEEECRHEGDNVHQTVAKRCVYIYIYVYVHRIEYTYMIIRNISLNNQ